MGTAGQTLQLHVSEGITNEGGEPPVTQVTLRSGYVLSISPILNMNPLSIFFVCRACGPSPSRELKEAAGLRNPRGCTHRLSMGLGLRRSQPNSLKYVLDCAELSCGSEPVALLR